MPHHHSVPDPRSAGVLTWFDRVADAATRYIREMKTASLPAVPVDPALRADVEAALEEGETLDEFIEEAVAERVRRRREARAAFIARGKASLEEVRRTGVFIPAEQVLRELEAKLEDAKRRKVAPGR